MKTEELPYYVNAHFPIIYINSFEEKKSDNLIRRIGIDNFNPHPLRRG